MRGLSGLLILIISLLLPSQAMAGGRPNLLIIGDYDDKYAAKESIATGVTSERRVFKRVINSLSNQLHDVGFDVYDETAVTLDKQQADHNDDIRRTDTDIIEIARTIQYPPIDVVVLFSINANAESQGSSISKRSKIRIRLDGRLLNVSTGQQLGSFEVKNPDHWSASSSCEQQCLLETISDQSTALATRLGHVLGQRLNGLIADSGADNALLSAFTLVFDNFSADEMMAIEEYLVVFSGYRSHRPIYNSMTRAEIWYQSTINTAKLNRNLHKMLTHLALRGIVQFSGNTFSLQKINMRQRRKS